MPAEHSATWSIACDNPACPGHPELTADDPAGWLFVSHEVYGEETQQAVYGSLACVAADTTAKAEDPGVW